MHTITGRDAVTVGPPVVVEVADDVVVVVDERADVPVVVECFGWVAPVDERGPDDPHAASASTSVAPAPASPNQRTPGTYAFTVRSSSKSANRRCASARRVGMCSLGTSCGV